jgi:IS30 family transposase
MLTQEEHMDVVALRGQGWTITQIAESTGKHPVTVSSWLKKAVPRKAPTADRPC